MGDYQFVTTWVFDAPVDRVFNAIDDCARWPQWWKGVRRAELLEEGDEQGVGRLWRYEWRSVLPYSLTFDARVTRVERPWLLEAHAQGELIGLGRWRFFEAGGSEGRGTAVTYEWNVRTSRAWMNRLAPLARPAFAWNHDAIMRQGAEGLQRLLDAPLLARS